MNIVIKDLKKSYGNKEVLNIDNLNLTKGLNCIMGSNGCGKTTLLNILSGQLDYEEGSITYDGKSYSKELSSNITLVHQNPYMLHRSVYENIAYPLKVRRLHKMDIKKKVNQIMKKLKITDLKAKKATDLSVGEAQKVSIARSLVFEPSILMLDEPTSNIDEASVSVIESVIQDYSRKNKTVIVVTHSSEQANRLSKHIINIA